MNVVLRLVKSLYRLSRAAAAVDLDADVVGRTGRHHVSLTGSAATLPLEAPGAVRDLADQAELVLLGVTTELDQPAVAAGPVA
jgi:hypothetical protein